MTDAILESKADKESGSELELDSESKKQAEETKKEKLIDEILMPELTQDFFVFEGKKIQIRLLTIRYQKQFDRVVEPFLKKIALYMAYKPADLKELEIEDIISLIVALMGDIETLCKLVQIIAANSGVEITDEEIENSTIQKGELFEIIAKYFSKKDGIEAQLADFFLNALPKLESQAVAGIQNVNKVISHTDLTSLWKEFANGTDGQSNTSPSE